MKSIWDNIKLAFGRKPQGDILLPDVRSGVEIVVKPQTKPRVTRKKKSDVNNT
jgi:hypothetical protein